MTDPRNEKSPRRLGGDSGAYANHNHRTSPILVSEAEAAKILGISPRKLHGLAKVDAVPRLRIGGRVLYAVSALEAWIDLDCPTAPGSAERVRAVARTGGAR
jgi:hypothetical protein